MGPIMLDVDGTSLTAEDKEILAHPLVGGLILFSRNFHSPEQVAALTADIREYAQGDILIAVDQEGGRVQRFKNGFSIIPAMGKLWQQADGAMAQALQLAKASGQLIALEVMSVGVDISFAPVLDINDISDVIGDRAFHAEPDKVCLLANAFIDGMHSIGMKCTAKHFPGHGSVKEDSHIALPVDRRDKAEILGIDMEPFRQLISAKQVNAVMPAHVIYPAFDDKSVGFSRFWLEDMLRGQLGFDGVIFSDDLSMAGAGSIGGFVERTEAAQQAGCDMLLVCNNRAAAIEVIEQANISVLPQSQPRLQKMLSKNPVQYGQLTQIKEWQQARQLLNIA
ncbi:beta-N-acetylhexosaminidase [Thalassotalea euphylliae]|uniref:Beta-hexosaminidase n=1 Tax=Thalassotalea euphylliae TaxID=1655234 RepID=A0A3E0TPS4_9GAMM|nr:beta-N-acetylhexosaminidase [Thalassotalea euphylliae]